MTPAATARQVATGTSPNALPFTFCPLPDVVIADLTAGHLALLDLVLLALCIRQRSPVDGTAPGWRCTKEKLREFLGRDNPGAFGKSERSIQRSFARLKARGHMQHVPDAADPTGYRIAFPSCSPIRLSPGTGRASGETARVSRGETARVSPPPPPLTRARLETKTETGTQNVNVSRSLPGPEPQTAKAPVTSKAPQASPGEPEALAPAQASQTAPGEPSDAEIVAQIAEAEAVLARPCSSSMQVRKRFDLAALRSLQAERATARAELAAGTRPAPELPRPTPRVEALRPRAVLPPCNVPPPEPGFPTDDVLRRVFNPSLGPEVVEHAADRLAEKLDDWGSRGFFLKALRLARAGRITHRDLLGAWKLCQSGSASNPAAVFTAHLKKRHPALFGGPAR